MGAQDMQTISNNAWREAFGYDVQAFQQETAGARAQAEGKQAMRNTLLTGGMQMWGGGLDLMTSGLGMGGGGKSSKPETVSSAGGSYKSYGNYV